MDTETVLKIISMLDTRIEQYEQRLLVCMDDADLGSKLALIYFRDHLQYWIKAQISYAENQTGE
jgi:hypothetical protein